MDQNTEKIHEQVSKSLSKLPLDKKLLIVSNLLFDDYQEFKKLDALYNNIEKRDLNNLENHSELIDLYYDSKESFVFSLLNAAHEVLSWSMLLQEIKPDKTINKD